MQEVLVPIVIFGGAAIVIWKFFDSRHRERMSIIEKGLNPADFKELYRKQLAVGSPMSSLKWGLLALFVGVGMLVAGVIDEWYHFDKWIYPAMMLISGGVGLVVYYFLAARALKEEKQRLA